MKVEMDDIRTQLEHAAKTRVYSYPLLKLHLNIRTLMLGCCKFFLVHC